MEYNERDISDDKQIVEVDKYDESEDKEDDESEDESEDEDGEPEEEDFATYVNGFHPSRNFTWVISDVQLPFLDLCLNPTPDRLLTSIYYKETDTHSYPSYTSSHPARCKNSIPYSQSKV